MLPPGQKARADFPRFGLPAYANRYPSKVDNHSVRIEMNDVFVLSFDLASQEIPRSECISNFHCVTTWSYLDARWGGVRFSDVYETLIRQLEKERGSIEGAVVCGQDGYKTSLILDDLLAKNVMLADTLDGQLLSIEHGAPLRLVMPEHYGYKNLKHLAGIKFYTKLPKLKRGLRAFLDHPRGRVKQEERGRWIPGWILRFVYRHFISRTEEEFRIAMEAFYKNRV